MYLMELFSVVVHFDDWAVDVVVGEVVELLEDVFRFLVVFEQGHQLNGDVHIEFVELLEVGAHL